MVNSGNESCFNKVTSSEVAALYADFRRCSHVFLYAKTDKLSIVNTPTKAAVLMQVRFDGCLGFPGGLVDNGETPTEGLKRECLEEIGLSGDFTDDDLLFIHVCKTARLVNYFYAKELTETELKQVIRDSVETSDFGYESFGLIIAPLYTMTNSFYGLPAFLTHRFIGNARDQLTEGLIVLNILSQDEIHQALTAENPLN